MERKQWTGFLIIIVVTIVCFSFFFLFHQKSTLQKAHTTIEEHTRAIAEFLLYDEQNTLSHYLKLAVKSCYYKRILVYNNEKKLLISEELPSVTGVFSFLSAMGLLPTYHIENDIFYNGQTIGKIVVDWQSGAFFTYLYIFLCIILFLLTLVFYLRFTATKAAFADRGSEHKADLAKSEKTPQEEFRDNAYITINNSPLVAFVWKNEPDWPVEFVTENVEKAFGYHPQKFRNSTVHYAQLIFPDDLEQVLEEVATYSADSTCNNFIHKPYRIVTKSGELRWIESRIYIRRNDKGEISHYHGILMDITDRINTETSQLKANHFLKLVLNSIPDRVFWKDTNSIYLGSNSAFCQDAGVESPDDLIGKTDYDLAFGKQAELFRKDDAEVMSSGKAKLFYEQVYNRVDGKTNWVLTSKVPIRDEQNIIIGVLGTYQDITDRKEAEEEVHNLRNYLANIINSMPSVLIGVDRHGVVTQWNAKAQQITGVTDTQAKGQPLEKAFPPLAHGLDRVKQAIAMKQIRFDPRQARKEENETRYEDVTIYPLMANGVEGAVIRVDDVTEQVRLEEMMIQSEKMLSVGGLAAGMAHEINNPLAGMIQTANVMKSRLGNLDIPANRKAADISGVSLNGIKTFMEQRGILRMIDTINNSGKRVAEIVENMLSFARKTDAIFSNHHPAQLLDQVLELAATDYDLKKQYDFKTIKIIKEYEKDIPPIPCEAAKIQQVLLNILRNGAQAMEADRSTSKEQPCFTLRLAVEEKNRILKIEIQDNGPGMDKATQSRVFEPFFSTKPVDEGTGLGLSVSYFIITQNHGGTMDVDSSPGNGTTFSIRLPLERSAETTDTQQV